jgi:uncharacterized protein (UPF0332 family)
MTLTDEDRDTLIKYNVEKSKQAIEDSQFLIENDKLYIAANRIYYGIFYILSALALKHRFSTKKHHQLHGWFNKNFIHTNIIDEKYSHIVKQSFKIRSDADYDVTKTFSKDVIEQSFEEMKEVISIIEKLL